jgi:hypothetical protein
MVTVESGKKLPTMLKAAKSCVLYDSNGKVVHIQECFGKRAESITNEAIEKMAFDSVVKRPDFFEEKKIDRSQLKVLHVKPEQLRHKGYVTYNVDLASKSLVHTPLKLYPKR